MSDTFVAIDASLLAGKKETPVGFDGARALARDIHRLGAMAISTFQGIVSLHPCPLVDRQIEAVVEKLFSRADSTKNLSPNFLRGLHFARDFIRPVVRHVTIGAMCAHS